MQQNKCTLLSLSLLKRILVNTFVIKWADHLNGQGSVLNPSLFNIFVNSLNDRLKAIFQNITDIIMLGEEISRTVTDMTDIKCSAD